MTSPPPILPSASLRTAGPRDHVRAALDDVAHAAATARRSLGVAWESVAADRFREDVVALLAAVDADQRLLEGAEAALR